MKWNYLFIVLAVGLLVSCYKEKDLLPSEGTEEIFKLPQGDHDYDAKIVNWFENYGFYALYVFKEKDLYWANQDWLEGGNPDVSTAGTEKGEPGDPEYVGSLVDMFEKLFLKNYPDEMIEKNMPLRVFLCANLWDYSRYDEEGNRLDDYLAKRIWIYEGWDNIAVNGASSYITDSLTREDQVDFSHDLNAYFIKKIVADGGIVIPDEFYAESAYDKTGYYGLELFENGYLEQAEYAIRNSDTDDSYKEFDLQTYIELVAYSWDYLQNGELEEIDSDDSTPSWSGIFKRLESTKVKKKYDIVVKALREAGVKMEGILTPPVVEY